MPIGIVVVVAVASVLFAVVCRHFRERRRKKAALAYDVFAARKRRQAIALDAALLQRPEHRPEPLENVTLLQVLCEIDSSSACEVLPPALHPTIPPPTITVWA